MPNDFIDCGCHYELILRNRKKQEVARTKIDKNDLEKALKNFWYLEVKPWGNKYAKTGRPCIGLHKFLLGEKRGLIIDHVNGNGLDNRRFNLRFVTHSQNQWNRRLSRNNKTGVIGVTYSLYHKKWFAKITFKNKVIRLGSFMTKAQAVRVRKKAENKYFGGFTREKSIARQTKERQ